MPDIMPIFPTIWPWIEASKLSILQLSRLAEVPHGRLYYSPHLLTRKQVQAIAQVIEGLRLFPIDKERTAQVADLRAKAKTRRAMAHAWPNEEAWGHKGTGLTEAEAAERLEAEADALEALLRPLTEQWAEVGVPERVYEPQPDLRERDEQPDGRGRNCVKCGYRWRNRKVTEPVKCPRCQSKSWSAHVAG